MNRTDLTLAFLKGVPLENQRDISTTYAHLSQKVRGAHSIGLDIENDFQEEGGEVHLLPFINVIASYAKVPGTPGHTAVALYRHEIDALAQRMNLEPKELEEIIQQQIGPKELIHYEDGRYVNYQFHLDLGGARREPGTGNQFGEKVTFYPPHTFKRKPDPVELEFLVEARQKMHQENILSQEMLPGWLREGFQQVADAFGAEVSLADYDGTIYRDHFKGAYSIIVTTPADNLDVIVLLEQLKTFLKPE